MRLRTRRKPQYQHSRRYVIRLRSERQKHPHTRTCRRFPPSACAVAPIAAAARAPEHPKERPTSRLRGFLSAAPTRRPAERRRRPPGRRAIVCATASRRLARVAGRSGPRDLEPRPTRRRQARRAGLRPPACEPDGPRPGRHGRWDIHAPGPDEAGELDEVVAFRREPAAAEMSPGTFMQKSQATSPRRPPPCEIQVRGSPAKLALERRLLDARRGPPMFGRARLRPYERAEIACAESFNHCCSRPSR